MKVYVAGSSSELDRVRAVMAALREAGHEITHDWTEDVLAAREAGHASDATVDDAHADKCAARDLRGIREADAFILLRREPASFGASFEAGYALAVATGVDATGFMRLHVVGSRRDIFLRRWEWFATDADAVAAIGRPRCDHAPGANGRCLVCGAEATT